jgi:hypothetical protein
MSVIDVAPLLFNVNFKSTNLNNALLEQENSLTLNYDSPWMIHKVYYL